MNKLQRIIGNILSLLTSDVVNRGTTFVMYALVARHLGAFEFGQMSLALSLFYTFQIFASLGLRTFLTRDISRDLKTTGHYLFHGTILVGVSSLISIAILIAFVQLMNYSPGTTLVVSLVSLGVFPRALATMFEAIFQAWEKMHFIAYANVPVNIAKIILALVLLRQNYGLISMINLFVACYIAVALIESWLMIRYVSRPTFHFDSSFAKSIIKTSIPFLGIDGILAISSSLTFVLLSKMRGEEDVGLYNAASQIMIPIILVYQSILLSVFPTMCQRFKTDLRKVTEITEQTIEVLLSFSFPLIVGVSFMAEQALFLFYGEQDFQPAVNVLRIIIWTLIMNALCNVLGQVLVAGSREKDNLRIIIVNTLIGFGMSVIFINYFGLIGAAISALAYRIIDYIQHWIPVSRMLPDMVLWKRLWKIVVSSLCTAGCLLILSGQNPYIQITTAGTVYISVLIGLMVWSSGGINQFKDKYYDPFFR